MIKEARTARIYSQLLDVDVVDGRYYQLVYCYTNGFTMSNLFQYGVNVFRPNEWFRVCVVQSDILLNDGHQIRYAFEHATANAFAGDFPEPPFDEVQP